MMHGQKNIKSSNLDQAMTIRDLCSPGDGFEYHS